MVLIVVAICGSDRFGQMAKGENCRDGAANQQMCLDKKQSPANPAGQWFSPWVRFLVLARKSSAARAEMPLYHECWTPRGQALSSGHAAKTRALGKVCGEQGDGSGQHYLWTRPIFAGTLLAFCWNLHANTKSAINFSTSFCNVISVFSTLCPWAVWIDVNLKSESPVGLCAFLIIFYSAVLWLNQV